RRGAAATGRTARRGRGGRARGRRGGAIGAARRRWPPRGRWRRGGGGGGGRSRTRAAGGSRHLHPADERREVRRLAVHEDADAEDLGGDPGGEGGGEQAEADGRGDLPEGDGLAPGQAQDHDEGADGGDEG